MLTHVPQWNVPLEQEGELLPFARRFVLCAHQDVVEEEEVPQLPMPVHQLHDEGVLHQVSLGPLLVREQLAGVSHVVFGQKSLHLTQCLGQCQTVRV